ncbi:MAG: hypothetical protein AAGJ46_05645 [Planctomycetota bacterium]
MSERERWIVYPLLFLALGAALRDKLLKQTVADQVICRQLVVNNEAGRIAAVINGEGLQTERLKAGLVDADRFQQSGRPLRPQQQSSGFPAQLMPLLRAFQGAAAAPSPQPPEVLRQPQPRELPAEPPTPKPIDPGPSDSVPSADPPAGA